MKRWLCIVLVAVALPLSVPAQARPAGSPAGQVSVLAGPSMYDLSGVGTALAINLGLAWRPLRRVLLVEPGLGILNYTTQVSERSHYLFPELSVQAEARLGAARPYLGGGFGDSRESLGGRSVWDFTLHAVGGVRFELGAGWGLRGELRIRTIGPSGDSTADLGFGATRRIF